MKNIEIVSCRNLNIEHTDAVRELRIDVTVLIDGEKTEGVFVADLGEYSILFDGETETVEHDLDKRFLSVFNRFREKNNKLINQFEMIKKSVQENERRMKEIKNLFIIRK